MSNICIYIYIFMSFGADPNKDLYLIGWFNEGTAGPWWRYGVA